MRRRLRLILLVGALLAGGIIPVTAGALVAHDTTVGPPLVGLAFRDVGGTDGYDPFTCPADAPSGCGALLDSDDTGEDQVGFEVPSGDGLTGGDTVTFTGPHGVDFANASFVVGWGGTVDDNVEPIEGGGFLQNVDVGCFDDGNKWVLTPDNDEEVTPSNGTGPGVLYEVDNDGCQHEAAATVVAVDQNSVTLELPAGFEQTPSDTANNWPAVIQATGVVNPPAGTYQPNQWTVAAASGSDAASDYSPGPISNSPVFANAANADPANTLLTVSSATVPVSDDTGVAVTATLRDVYGNPVPDTAVAIEPLSGNASPIDTAGASTSTTTGTDGTYTEQFSDTVAQTVQFGATVTSHTVSQSFAIEQTPAVTFTAGPPVAANSFIELAGCTAGCAPETQVSSAGGTLDVRVGLADQYGNPDLGDEVVLAPQQPGQFKLGTVAEQNSACPSGGTTPIITGAACAITPDTLTAGASTYIDATADFSVADPTAEAVPFSVDDISSGTTLALTPLGISGTSPLTVDFLAGPPSTTSISVASAQVTADGTSSDPVTVTLLDANGNPVSGLSVALQAGPGNHATISADPVTTNAQGQAQFTITDGTVEPVTLTAAYTGTVDGAAVNGTVSGSATVNFVAGPTSSTNSMVLASLDAVPDNGLAASTVTVTLLDAEGHPAAGRVVTLAGSAGTSSQITPEPVSAASSGCATQASAGTTDCHGQAQFSVSDTVPESVTYTATDQSAGVVVAQTAAVTYTAPPSAATSTLVATPQTVVADGSTQATVAVTLEDAAGQPVVGRQVCLTQTAASLPSDDCATQSATTPSAITAQPDPGSSCLGAPPAPGTTNCDGQALFTVTATAPGTITYGVIDLSDDGPDGPLLGPYTTVGFTRAPTESGESSVTAMPAQVLAGAAGSSGTATVAVQLLTGTGAALSGHQITLAASSPSATVTPVASPATGCGAAPPAGTTDCNGVATFTVSDTRAEAVTFTATDTTAGAAVLQTAVVAFLADEATNATVAASPTSAIADNGLSNAGVAVISVELAPGQAGADSGDRVSLSQPSGDLARIVAQGSSAAVAGCPAAAAPGIANCHGAVSFAVSDARPETVTFTAIDTTTGVSLGQTATVTFSPIAPLLRAITPAAGPLAGGTILTIHGVGLSHGATLPQITVGGRRATEVQCAAITSCTARVPAGARPGVVTVRLRTTIGTSRVTASAGDRFTYTVGRPQILTVTPGAGSIRGGTTVTITGRNLEAARSVSFGSTRVVVRKVNAAGTRLTVRAPAQLTGTVEIRVTTASGTSATSSHTRFRYRPAAVATTPTNRK